MRRKLNVASTVLNVGQFNNKSPTEIVRCDELRIMYDDVLNRFIINLVTKKGPSTFSTSLLLSMKHL